MNCACLYLCIVIELDDRLDEDLVLPTIHCFVISTRFFL